MFGAGSNDGGCHLVGSQTHGELSLAQLKKLVEGEGAAFSIGPSGGQGARTRP